MHYIKEVPIAELAKFEGGSQPPKREHIYMPRNGYIRFVQNRDYSTDSHLTFIPISKNNKVCSETDIMMDKYGEAGMVRYGIAGAYNVALMKISPAQEKCREYLRDFLSQSKIKEFLFNSSQASTRPSLNAETFNGINVPLPSEETLEQYQSQMDELLWLELKLNRETSALRDEKTMLLAKYFPSN